MTSTTATIWNESISGETSTAESIAYTTVNATGKDCRSKLIHALRPSLRQVKSDFETNITQNIVGRTTGSNIDFTNNTYEELKMRRKAEILQYKKKDTQNITKKQKFAEIAKGNIGKRNSVATATNPNPLNYQISGGSLIVPSTYNNNVCNNTNIVYVNASRSNVPSSYGEFLYLDPSIKFYSTL